MIINSVITSGGSAPSGKYQMLQRIKDDSNNDVGIVVGFHKDSSNNEYAVVCLDAVYRPSTSNFQWMSSQGDVTGLPSYGNITMYDAPETSTFNCDKMLEYATANNYTSSAVSECRGHSFVIDGVTYYGQLPSISAMVKILQNRTNINSNDPSQSGPAILTTYNYITSTQKNNSSAIYVSSFDGLISGITKNSSWFDVIPILELPNA